MIRLVVFDMAGTTIDEDNVVYKTVQKSINAKGYQISLDKVLAEGAGKEKRQAIQSILKVYENKDDQALTDEIYENFSTSLNQAYELLPVYPQPHVYDLFSALRSRKIFIVLNTGYNSQIANLLIQKLGWKKGKEFDYLITASDVPRNRPYPDMINLAMEVCGIQNPMDVVKVGDSIIDIEEGLNAGCKYSIGITTGAHSSKQLVSASPDYVINDLFDLVEIIDNEH
jgi:phosphonatase-like hydrolase